MKERARMAKLQKQADQEERNRKAVELVGRLQKSLTQKRFFFNRLEGSRTRGEITKLNSPSKIEFPI